MDKLNNKIITGQDEKRFNTQNVGLYGYDGATDGGVWRRVAVNTSGELEMTAEISTAGLATSANQDTMINATNRDINNTTGIGDGTSQATSLALGYDRSNGQGRAILVDSGGRIVTTSTSTDNVKLEDLSSQLNSGITNDPANSLAVGLRARQTIADASTETFLKCDGSGILSVKEVGTVNVGPSNDTNSHITDDPANSVAVGLKGRTTIGTATTEQFLLCDSDGHLQVDILSGGGGSASNVYNKGGTEETLSVLAPTAPATSKITSASTIYDLQNFRGIAFNITTTSASYFDIVVAVEFSNSATFLTTLGAAYSDIQTFNLATDAGSNPITGRYVANLLMIPEFNSQQPQARYARVTFNHSNNAGSAISVVINGTAIPF